MISTIASDGLQPRQNAQAKEISIKNTLKSKSWKFRIINEASNATKHAIRKLNAKDVATSSSIQHTTMDGVAYFSGSDGGVVIDVDWVFVEEKNVFVDSVTRDNSGCDAFLACIHLTQL